MAEPSYSISTTCGNQCEASYRIYAVAWKEMRRMLPKGSGVRAGLSRSKMVALTHLF
jgi:hypothetical protein